MFRRLLLACLCTVVAASSWGQTPSAQPPTFRADTRLVQVTVVVTDSRQNPVRDLKASDFRVFEDGKEQPISVFSADSRSSGSTALDLPAPGSATVSNQVPVPAPPQTAETRQNTLVRALASPLNAVALPLTVNLEPAANGELRATLRLNPSSIRLNQTAPDTWEGAVDVAIAHVLPDGALAKALDVTVALRFTTAMRDQALRDGLNLNRRIRPNPDAHALRIAVRDPATGAVGSVAISADVLRSVRGR